MKKTTLTLLAVLLFCAGWGASQIRWTWHDKPIVQLTWGGTNTLQLGLRDDGVVVWREIANTTNSPAEAPGVMIWNTVPLYQIIPPGASAGEFVVFAISRHTTTP